MPPLTLHLVDQGERGDGGAYRGRKKSLTAAHVAELTRRSTAGEPQATVAREFGTSPETVYQCLRAGVIGGCA